MPLSFPKTAQSAFLVGRTPWSAADAHVGLLGLDESDFTGEERVQGGPAVAVGMPVSRHPPHGPVLALLTHTVLTLDQGMFGVETLGRIRLQDLDWRE
jgi:hypothetical protein